MIIMINPAVSKRRIVFRSYYTHLAVNVVEGIKKKKKKERMVRRVAST